MQFSVLCGNSLVSVRAIEVKVAGSKHAHLRPSSSTATTTSHTTLHHHQFHLPEPSIPQNARPCRHYKLPNSYPRRRHHHHRGLRPAQAPSPRREALRRRAAAAAARRPGSAGGRGALAPDSPVAALNQSVNSPLLKSQLTIQAQTQTPTAPPSLPVLSPDL